ncbi:Receptor-like protein kinase [Quillaja saponaria]|uniref:non-specific serine/threonine protein kinase n=1 Tax=Quillaja saponaria TaxID=32244 RepID=A0AAD7M2G4_QUISA|nr:Receptor-like protein kinase [Quillaja saponaria]
MAGTIPDEIGKLSILENLGLQFNTLTGDIPSAIINISTIVEILLTSNQLTSSLPPNLGLTLPNLERLHLYNNSLTGPILSSISNSTKLTELDLAYNSFSSYIPSTLSDLRNLQWRLAYNNLTFDSSSHAMRTFLSLGNCKYLQRIELSENPLNFVLPTSIGNFSSFLDHFGLENSKIKGGIPDDIGNIRGLNFLNLASNEITGTIPAIIGNVPARAANFVPLSQSITRRLNIMIDVAAALDYLRGHSTPIVHCDLKPNNLLLDEDMVGHVTDFGIAKLLGEGDTMTNTMTLATIGYMAPEYGLEGTVSRRGDVYAYGILLMETFTRHKPTDEMFLGELSLKQWVQRSFPHAILEIVDGNLLREEEEHFDIKKDCLPSIMGLSLHCSAEAPEDRTNMNDVLVVLNKMKKKSMNEAVRIK